MTKYHVKLESGRDVVISADDDIEVAANEALEEAALMDDYLIDLEPIHDV